MDCNKVRKKNWLTLARSTIFSFFPTGPSASTLMFTLGIVKNTPNAPIKHHIPTHRKGSKNPPAWYKTEPTAGPEKDSKG